MIPGPRKVLTPESSIHSLACFFRFIFIASVLLPVYAFADSVEPWNGDQREGGNNNYIRVDDDRWNEFNYTRELSYQVHYYVNYNLLDDDDRTIRVTARLYEDDLFDNDLIGTHTYTCPSYQTRGIADDTNGLHVFIGPRGCIVRDDTNGWENTNTSSLGWFEYTWSERGLVSTSTRAEFKADIDLSDNSSSESYPPFGFASSSKKIYYENPGNHIRITSPQSGTYSVGDRLPITWDSDNFFSPNVAIELDHNGDGRNDLNITRKTTNDGAYHDYEIPQSLAGKRITITIYNHEFHPGFGGSFLNWNQAYSDRSNSVSIRDIQRYDLSVLTTGADDVYINSSTGHSGYSDYIKRDITSGTTVRLTAPPSSGNANFNNWSGCSSSNGRDCTVTMSGNRTVTANYNTQNYDLTVNASGTNSVSIASSTGHGGTTNYTRRDIDAGTTVRLTAPASSGNANFTRWSGCSSNSGRDCTVTISGNQTVTAYYETPEYDLTVNASGALNVAIASSTGHGGTTNYTRQDIDAGTAIRLSAPASTGSAMFINWSGCTSASGSDCIVNITDNLTVTAYYETPAYDLTVTANGANNVFISSTTGHSGTTNYVKNNISSGTSVRLSAPTSVGNANFTGWNGCSSTNGYECSVSMTGNVTVTAVYGTPVFNLDVTSTGVSGVPIESSTLHDGTTDYSLQSLEINTRVELTAPENFNGYALDYWDGCDEVVDATCLITLDGNREVSANYLRLNSSYSLSVAADGVSGVVISSTSGHGGTPPYSRELLTSGTEIVLTAPANADGKQFDFWNGCDFTTNNGTICHVNMTRNKSVIAYYKSPASVYDLTVNVDGASGVYISSSTGHGGTTSYMEPELESGTLVSLTAPFSVGSINFDYWEGCTTITNSGRTCHLNMTGDKSVTAHYLDLAADNNLTVYSNGATNVFISSASGHDGTTTYTETNLDSGTEVILTAPSNSGGSHFDYWQGCSSTSNDGRTCHITMTNNKSVTAYFSTSSSEYDLTINTSGASSVFISSTTGHSGSTRYYEFDLDSGTDVVLTAPSTAGNNDFDYWSGCNSTSNEGRTCHVTMTSNKSVTAFYAQTSTQYDLTVNSAGNDGINIFSATGHGGFTNYTKNNLSSGTYVNLTAPSASNGLLFDFWSDCDSTSDNGRTCNITMTEDKKVVANYAMDIKAPGFIHISGSSTGITMEWESVDDATSYRIYRCTSDSISSCVLLDEIESLGYIDQFGESGRLYHYRLQSCINSCGKIGEAETARKPGSLPAPTILEVIGDEQGVYLRWEGTGDPSTEYRVYRCENESETSSSVCNNLSFTLALEFTDENGEPGIKYFYRVRACEITCSIYSPPVAGTKIDTRPPVPFGVTASDGDNNEVIRVNWRAVPDADYYLVARCSNENESSCDITISDIFETFLDWQSGFRDVIYYFRIKACNEAGCSKYSDFDSGFKAPPREEIPAGEPPRIQRIHSLDGSRSNAKFGMGAYSDEDNSVFSDTFSPGETVTIIGEITPDDEDLGKYGNIFAAVRSKTDSGVSFSFLNMDGFFEFWDLTVTGLRPALEVSSLEEIHILTIYKGNLAPGVHKIYMAYIAEGGVLTYTGQALTISIVD